MEELRMVRGLGDDFWATFVEPDPEQPDKRVLTVWGASGALNVNTAAPQTLLAQVCSMAVDETPLCKDPLEMQKFLTVVTLARGFTMGAPPFSSPRAFLNALQGKGMLGPLIAAAGLQPIQVKSMSEAEKMLTTESKVFSLYSTGIVRAGKRETRVRVHAVVDYRNAPPPTVQELLDRQAGDSGATGPSGAKRSGPDADTAGEQDEQTETPDALTRALQPSAAGNVVYFRVD
jgi:general secretion pathway protein K